MTRFSFGDIVLVPFPFTDLTATKRRPAVIVSSAEYNDRRPDVVVMAITSQVRRPIKTDEIEINQWQKAGLVKLSVIKPVFSTIEAELILRRLGSLDRDAADSVRTLLREILR